MTSFNLISFYYLVVIIISYPNFYFYCILCCALTCLIFFDHDHEFQKTQHLERSPRNPVITFPSTSSSKRSSTFLLPASSHVYVFGHIRVKMNVSLYLFQFLIYIYIYLNIISSYEIQSWQCQ